MGPDPARSPALSVEDQFLLKIAHKNGILSGEQIGLATANQNPPERIADVLLRLRLLNDRQLKRLREAMAASQVVRLDALYAGIIGERSLLPQQVVERAFAEQRRQRFRVRLGNILLEQGAINPAMHRKIISAVIKRLRTEGNEAYTSAVEPLPDAPQPPPRDDSDFVTEPLAPPPGIVGDTHDPFATENNQLSPLMISPPTPQMAPSVPIPPTHPPRIPLSVAETQEMAPSILSKDSDGHYRALLVDGLSAKDLQAEPDAFMVSAIQIGLESDDSMGFRRSDAKRLEFDLRESKDELPDSNFVLDRLEIASGESTEFIPDEYLQRKKNRTRALQIGGAALVVLVVLTGAALLTSVARNRSALSSVRALLAQADAAEPAKRLPLLREADGLLAKITGPGVGDSVRSELEQQLRWGLLRAEALEILDSADPGAAKTLLEARAGHVPAFAEAEHTALLERAERDVQLAEAQDAERRNDIPRAVVAYRSVLALGDPGGKATARLTAIRGSLMSVMNEAYATALESLTQADERKFFDAAKQINDLFDEDAGAGERIEEIGFRRAMREGRRLLDGGELEEAKKQFQTARKLRPNDRTASDWVERVESREAQRSDEDTGRAADARKEYAAAIAAYERAKKHADLDERRRLDAAIAKSRRMLNRKEELNDRRRRRREGLALMRESKVDAAITLLQTLNEEAKDPKTAALLEFALKVNGMVYVAPGPFLMGSKKGRDARSIERPQRKVELPGYFIDRTEVTNEAYAAFLASQDKKAKAPSHWNHPVRQKDGSVRQSYDPAVARHPLVNINWAEALAYALWRGGNLPTEAQWEKAARGTEGRTFPWGLKTPVRAHIEIRPNRLRAHKTAAVGTHVDDRSPCGAMDMAGNVNEWTLDLLVPYPGAPKDAKPAQGRRAIRGGAYRWPYRDARCAARDSMQETYRSPTVGFRVVVDVPKSIPPLR